MIRLCHFTTLGKKKKKNTGDSLKLENPVNHENETSFTAVKWETKGPTHCLWSSSPWFDQYIINEI